MSLRRRREGDRQLLLDLAFFMLESRWALLFVRALRKYTRGLGILRVRKMMTRKVVYSGQRSSLRVHVLLAGLSSMMQPRAARALRKRTRGAADLHLQNSVLSVPRLVVQFFVLI